MPDAQIGLDLRALELAAGNAAVLAQHLIECGNRYKSTTDAITALRRDREESSRVLYTFLWKIAGSLVTLLLVIIGYLLSKGGFPGHG